MNPPKTSRQTGERKYSSRACMECRRKKVKCDNRIPKCSPCVVYGTECMFGEDRRRNNSSQKPTANNETRCDFNEELTRSSPISVSKSSWQDNQMHNLSRHNVLPAPATGTEIDQSQLNVTVQQDHAEFSSDLLPDDCWFGIHETEDFDILRSPITFGNELDTGTIDFPTTDHEDHTSLQGGSHQDYSYINQYRQSQHQPFLNPQQERSRSRESEASAGHNLKHEHTITHPDDTSDIVDDLTQRLTSRMGQLRISGNGMMRYYGVTSNLHMMNDELLSLFSPVVRNTREDGEIAIQRLQLNWERDTHYEQHLLDLYFAWHDPFIQEVDRDIFECQREEFFSGKDTTLYSPALENAMLSVGACYSNLDRPNGEGNSSDFFAARARVYLDIELDSPSIATAQAVIVLCVYEGATGGDSRGWLYAGMCGHIVIDLGFHMDAKVASSFPENVDREKAAHRRSNLFWSAYVAETFWGFYSGRPPLIANLKHMVPSPSAPAEYKWSPHTESDVATEIPPGMRTDLIRFVPSYLAQIAMRMTKIADALYTGIPGSIADLRGFVTYMTSELEQWKASMPPDMFIDLSQKTQAELGRLYPPMITQVNMQYHAAMILLHRPFVSEAFSPSALDQSPLGSSQICTDAATAISRLLVIFRRNYSWRYIHLQAVHNATIAGVVHAYDSCVFPSERGKRAQEELHVCIQALGEMALSFKSSTRGLEIIGTVRREWQKRRIFQAGVKRVRASGGEQRLEKQLSR